MNHILTATHGKKIAVIENEFGDVGIDDALLAKNTKMQADEEIIEMMNGCICCTVRQDLIVVLKNLAKRQRAGYLISSAEVVDVFVSQVDVFVIVGLSSVDPIFGRR